MKELVQDVRRLHVLVVVASIALLLLNQTAARAARRSVPLESFDRLVDAFPVLPQAKGATLQQKLEAMDEYFNAQFKTLEKFPEINPQGELGRALEAEKDQLNAAVAALRMGLIFAGLELQSVFELEFRQVRERLAQLSKSDEKLAVTGISVYAGQVLLLGPILVLFLVLLLLAHVRELARQPLEAIDQPWIALFHGRLSQLLFHGSIVLGPPASTLSVFWATARPSYTETVVLLSTTLLVAVVGLLVSTTVVRWRRTRGATTGQARRVRMPDMGW